MNFILGFNSGVFYGFEANEGYRTQEYIGVKTKRPPIFLRKTSEAATRLAINLRKKL